MDIDPKNPAASLPPALRELLVMLTFEKYRPELVERATQELGGLVALIFTQQTVTKAAVDFNPALSKMLASDRMGNDLVSKSDLEVARLEVAKLVAAAKSGV